jgi:hypothetical protein
LGYLATRGYIYGGLTLQVEGVLNESVRCGHEFCGTGQESDSELYE